MRELLNEIHFTSETWLLLAPCIVIGFDFLTGCIYAWSNKIFSSKKLRSGLSKKFGEIIMIILGMVLTYALGLPHYIISGISLYIIFMEVISILENLSKMGVPLPKKIKDVLNNNPEDQFMDAITKKGEKDDVQ